MGLFESKLMKSVNQTPTIVICTDASFDPELKIGAWAAYVRSGDKVIKYSRMISEKVENSTEAERVGVAAGLFIANTTWDISKYRLIVYCDNESAMYPVKPSQKTGQAKQYAKKQQEFFEKNINRYLQKAEQADRRHVKGHLDRSSRHRMKTRHHLQDWCDKEAKKTLDEWREQLKLKSKEPIDF